MAENTIMIKIALDSNIFRNRNFLNWLIVNKSNFKISISIIVYLETLFWHFTRLVSIEDFSYDLTKINAEVISLDINLSQSTAKNALKSKLLFKHHARDFIIGSTAISNGAILLTYNKRHFLWMPEGKVKNPEEFVEHIISSNKNQEEL